MSMMRQMVINVPAKDYDRYAAMIDAVLSAEPCSDAISRQAVLDEFELDQYHDEYCAEHNIEPSISMELVRARLHDLPPVHAEPRTGHWIHKDAIIPYCKCSECGYKEEQLRVKKYCPNCGSYNGGK